jgi:acyl-CoA thioesterase I|tara:strand:+ start:1583 stop:1720 length:138 start_codon:yes stop_codon:yes gene_type:complete
MIKRFIIKVVAFCLVSINVNAIENVILFGDSLMAGHGLPQGGNYP